MLNRILNTDFLIIGGGIAGLNAAYHASKYGMVTLITKTNTEDSNSYLAQGGVAVTIDENDSPELHTNDTLIAGRGLCNEEAVRILVEEGRERVIELIESGMEFDKDGISYSLGMEGGHSARRILHANGAATGRAIVEFLISQVRNNDSITMLEDTQCIELINQDSKILGSYSYNKKDDVLVQILAKATIITSGGYSRLFERSTNSNTILGEGISLAQKAGAIIKDMEFVQFHPTAFYMKNGKSFLISEAVRGEGAYLLNEKLERFMIGKHDQKELAPRDIIAKTIFLEIQKSSIDNVYLDLRHLDPEKIKSRFINIYNMAKQYSIDITTDLIPISPAAHYSIGGIETDLYGRTNLEGLYACGEVSVTGVHGANRLASNSLLECLVFSKRAVSDAKNILLDDESINELDYKLFKYSDNNDERYKEIRKKVQNIFINYVGIIRDEISLTEAKIKINQLKNYLSVDSNEISELKSLDLLNLSLSIVDSAIARKESRGTHQRSDYPNQSDAFLGNYYIENSEIKFEESIWTLQKII